MRRIPYLVVGILLLATPCQAADYIVHVPDQWVDEGIRWQGFHRGRSDQAVTKTEKITFFVNECLLEHNLALDSAMLFFSRGKFKNWQEGGVSIDPVGEQIIVHVPDHLIIESVEREGYQDTGDDQARAQFFLDKVVLSPVNTWLLDLVVKAKTWGKIKNWEASGITVETVK